MKMEVKKENYNRLLRRKEVNVHVEHPEEATPSMDAVKELVSKTMNADRDKIEVKEVMTLRGAPESDCLIFVWDEKIAKEEDAKKPEGKEGEKPGNTADSKEKEAPKKEDTKDKAVEQEAEVVAEQVEESVAEGKTNKEKEKVEEEIKEVVEETIKDDKKDSTEKDKAGETAGK